MGKGSFGKVIVVRKKTSRRVYAMKVLNKANIAKRKQVAHTNTERRVMEYTSHPFVVGLHYAFQTRDKLYFVLDYCAGGELFYHLGRAGRFPEAWSRVWAAELVLALEHLHSVGVVFRDLKPENVLFDAQGHVKLADFGLSKEGVSKSSEGARSFCGTPEYLAPEILDRKGHGTAVDWWNLGMVTYEMLTGLPPWYTKNRRKLFERIRHAPLAFPDHVGPEARALLRGLLRRDPPVERSTNAPENIACTHRCMSHTAISYGTGSLTVAQVCAPPYGYRFVAGSSGSAAARAARPRSRRTRSSRPSTGARCCGARSAPGSSPSR